MPFFSILLGGHRYPDSRVTQYLSSREDQSGGGLFRPGELGVWIRKSCPEIGSVWFYNQFIALMFLLSWYIMIPFFGILFFLGTCFIWPGHSLTLTFLLRDQPCCFPWLPKEIPWIRRSDLKWPPPPVSLLEKVEGLRNPQKWVGVVDVLPPGFSSVFFFEAKHVLSLNGNQGCFKLSWPFADEDGFSWRNTSKG